MSRQRPSRQRLGTRALLAKAAVPATLAGTIAAAEAAAANPITAPNPSRAAAAHPGQPAVCIFSATATRPPGSQATHVVTTLECDHHGVASGDVRWWDNRVDPFALVGLRAQPLSPVDAGLVSFDVDDWTPTPVGHTKADYCPTVALDGHLSQTGCTAKDGPV